MKNLTMVGAVDSNNILSTALGVLIGLLLLTNQSQRVSINVKHRTKATVVDGNEVFMIMMILTFHTLTYIFLQI